MITRRALLTTALLLAATGSLHAEGIAASMFKNPGCECCDAYAAYLRNHGFTVTVKAAEDLAQINRKAGIPEGLEGCHAVFIGRYFVSGHVPFEAVQKLLSEESDIKGITLAGMPAGSPGMSGDKQEPFLIQAIGKDGKTTVFMTV